MSTPEENDQLAQRLSKLDEIKAERNAYPNDFKREQDLGDLADLHGSTTKETLAEKNVSVSVAGRIMTRRMMG
ncbi:MAG: lysine--tRNA ligase, partial [Proteobacteria bacterium]|nr:lysine--tRNA ligase [Pseudomonadota bacterium]